MTNRTPYVPPSQRNRVNTATRATSAASPTATPRPQPKFSPLAAPATWRFWLGMILSVVIPLRVTYWYFYDRSAAAAEAWQTVETKAEDFHRAFSTMQAGFGSRTKFESLQATLNEPAGRLDKRSLEEDIEQPLRFLTKQADARLQEMDDLEDALRSADDRLNTLASSHRWNGWWSDDGSGLKSGYNTLAEQCETEAASLAETADRISTHHKKFDQLVERAETALTFLAELRPHLDRPVEVRIEAAAYRLQLLIAVTLCLDFVEFFETSRGE